MEENIVQALFNCTQSDNETRKTSEAFLESLKSEPGFGILLVQISFNQAYTLQIRQVASILVKNQCKKWKNSTFPQGDKDFIKENLVKCLKFSVVEPIRLQFEEVAYVIGRHENDLNLILNQVETIFKSNEVNINNKTALSVEDLDEMYAGLNTLFQLSKKYEYVINEKRTGLKPIIFRFFDSLLNLLPILIPERHFSHINLVVQIFWVAFYLDYFGDLVSGTKLNAWLNSFSLILQVGYDAVTISDHYEQEKKTKEPKYQTFKWVAQIVHRFFSRFHDYKAKVDTSSEIGQIFTSVWVKVFLDLIIVHTFQSTKIYIPDITVNYYIKYLNQSIKYKPTCEYLSTLQLENGEFVIPSLITQIITPTVSKTPYDEELWIDNPIEYIRRQSDLSSVYYSASNACIDLLDTICSHGYLQQFLTYLSGSLSNQLSPITKESLMNQVGCLAMLLKSDVAFEKTIEDMLTMHIFSELSSSIGFLVARACWVYGQFSSINFTNKEHQQQVLTKICTLVQSDQLPIKFEAAVCLPKILSWEIAKNQVKNEISGVLKIYLDMINEIDSEEVIEALEDIVTQFSEQVLPFAVDLSRELNNNFLRLAMREGLSDDDDSAMAAVSVLNTIQKIIETINDKPEELFKVSLAVQPSLEFSLSEKGLAFMEEGLNLLSSLLYYTPCSTLVHLIPCYRLVLESLKGPEPFGLEKHEEIFPVLANFISKYLLNNLQESQDLVNFLVQLIGADTSLTVLSGRLLICVFENLKSSISSVIPLVFPKVFETVQNSQNPKEKAICCQVAYVMIWADTFQAMTFLESQNIFKPLLNYSLNNLKYVKEKLSRVQVTVALACLFPLINSFPNSLSLENSAMLFKRLVEIILIMESDGKDEDNQESPFVDAEEFNERAEEIIQKIRGNFEDDNDDDEVLFETDADEFYDSVFEKIDYKTFVKAEFTKVNQEVLAYLTSTIDDEQKLLLAKFF